MGGFKNVLKCLIFIELTNLFSLNVNAQNISDSFQVVGVVKDSISEKGISYVTITVQNEKGMVKCLASDSLGKFDFTLNLSGKNDIIFHSVGYQLRKIPLLYEGKNKKVDLGTILLSAANEKIGEVTIVVQKPLVRIEIDKIVYSMETDPESKTNNVIEMLRKVPLISVDGEDNIQVKGSTNFKILVNGKSSSMISQNYKDVLRSMPASTVREIEVITDPSSKYEAEGTAGIINIITMRKKSDGFTVKLNTRADSRGGYSAGLYSAAKINNFGFSLNYNYNKWKQPQTESYSTRENFLSSTNYYTKSEGTGKYNGVYNYLASEASYEIDTLRLISLSFMGYFGKFYGDGETMTWNFDQNMNVTRQFENLSNYIGRYRYFSGNIDYQRTFKKPDKTFTVSYKLEDFTRNIDNQNEILGLINYNSYHQKTSNIPTGREHTFQLDYFDPLSKTHQVETGVKYILRQNISNSGVFMYDSTINDWVQDFSRIYDLDYNQHIIGVYAGYTLKREKITLKTGLRAEGTINDGLYKSTTDTTFTNKMFNLVPYIALSKNLKKGKTVKLSYTQRLSRPGIWYLNPFYDDSDPLNVRYGNPGLNAEVSHTFDFTYGKFSEKFNINFSVNSAFTNNSIESISTMNEEGVRTTTYDNIGKNQRYGINIYGSASIRKKISLNTNVAMYYTILESNNSLNLSNKGMNYNGSLNIRYNVWKGGTFSGYAGIYSSRVTLQSTTSLWINHNLSYVQEFFNKKLSLTLSAINPFTEKLKWEVKYEDPAFEQINTEYYYNRQFRINLAYNFGQMKGQIKKARRGIKNEDVKSDGDSTGTVGGQ